MRMEKIKEIFFECFIFQLLHTDSAQFWDANTTHDQNNGRNEKGN